MKKVLKVRMFLMVLIFASLAILFRSDGNVRFVSYILLIFCGNFIVANGPAGRPGYILFKKTEYKIKKIIVFDFETYPHIPIRLILHQIISILFLVIGITFYFILYLYLSSSGIPENGELLQKLSLYYSFGIGGFILLFFICFQLYEFSKYSGEFYVDIKFIK